MRSLLRVVLAASTLVLVGCVKTSTPPAGAATVHAPAPPKPTIESVDLTRYMGTWYEIAAYPNRFERNCRCTFADYTLDEKRVRVTNSCIRGNSQRPSTVKGKAFPVPGSNNTKLRVQFFWPFRGDYWILYLDPDYQYTLVGSPDHEYLWILARTRSLGEPELLKLKGVAKDLGYDPDKLVMTDQQNCLPTPQ